MKKRIYLLVGALCIIMQLVSSCTNFLEVEEKGKTTIPSFLSDPDGLNAGLVGAYNKMYAYYDNEFTKYPDVAGNMLSMKYVSAGADMLDQYNFTSDALQETGSCRVYLA